MKKHPYLLLGLLQIFVAIGALPAGYVMITDPSGKSLGMTTDMLAGSHFHNFLVPGIFLFTVNGIFHLVAGIISIKKKKYSWLPGTALGICPDNLDYGAGVFRQYALIPATPVLHYRDCRDHT